MEDREREREMRARDVERDGRHRVESNPPPLSTRRRQPAQSGVSRETAAIHIEAHIDRERERESTSCQLFGSKKKTAINFIIIVIIIII